MRTATLLLATAALVAAMVTTRRAGRRSPTDTPLGRRLLAAALVCFAAHLVVLGIEGV